MKRYALLLALTMVQATHAQTAPEDPTAGSEEIAGDALHSRLSGKVFTYTFPAMRGPARLEYASNGFVYFNSGNASDTGRWRVEGNQLCAEWKRLNSSCAETRAKGNLLIVKRGADGTWATLTPN